MTKKILAVIGARGGSQGVPRKNVMPMCGKPLIAWSIERGQKLPEITNLIVSTDDPEIADVARSFGAEVPFVRPAHLANATAGKFQVWQHALDFCEKHYGTKYDIFVDMDCTNPLLDSEDLKGIIERFRVLRREQNIDGIFTVSPSYRSPYFNLLEEEPDGSLQLSKKPEKAVVARQAAKKSWDIVAGIYVMSPDYIKSANGLMDGKMFGYPVSREKAFDIDDPLDAKIVQYLMSEKKENA